MSEVACLRALLRLSQPYDAYSASYVQSAILAYQTWATYGYADSNPVGNTAPRGGGSLAGPDQDTYSSRAQFPTDSQDPSVPPATVPRGTAMSLGPLTSMEGIDWLPGCYRGFCSAENYSSNSFLPNGGIQVTWPGDPYSSQAGCVPTENYNYLLCAMCVRDCVARWGDVASPAWACVYLGIGCSGAGGSVESCKYYNCGSNPNDPTSGGGGDVAVYGTKPCEVDCGSGPRLPPGLRPTSMK